MLGPYIPQMECRTLKAEHTTAPQQMRGNLDGLQKYIPKSQATLANQM